MRVCHVITRFIRGGADENTLLSCNAQSEEGHAVSIVYGHEVDERVLARLDPRVTRHPLHSLRRRIAPVDDLLSLWRMYRLFRATAPDIVHTHTSKAGIIGRLAAGMAGVPVIIHGVHILPFVNVGPVQKALYWVLEKITAVFTDAFVNVGVEMRDECLRAGIGSEARHVVIPSGMNVARFLEARQRREPWRSVLPEARLDIAEPRFLLLVSRLEVRKGQYDFLPVFARLAQRHPEAVLVLAGEGPDYARIERRIAELALGKRVVLAGFRDDIERLMAIADIGVLTSRREGLPRVVIQYALMNLPIVATEIPGVTEVVTHGQTGFLVSPDDLGAMLEPLEQLLRPGPERQQMRERLARLDLRRWSVEAMNESLSALYRSLAAKCGRALAA
jgi:glycosyltransferase involved in cell wall biosynthesis